MATRTCAKCSRAENPLSRLRFKKSQTDGKIYCENCAPITHSLDAPPSGRVPEHMATLESRVSSSPSTRKPSAGYVVVDCPDCAGGVHRPRKKPCLGCAGYGAVRIETSMLNVYRPQPMTAPEILTED